MLKQMRKLHFFLLAITCILSCVKQEGENVPISNESILNLQIGSCSTKTFIDGSSSASSIPVWWSVGDVINVNGQKSSEYEGQGGSTCADFKINNVFPPYRVLYPHTYHKGDNADGTINVEIPSVQDYTPNSFAVGSMVMYGYSDDETINCQYACGAIKIGLIGSSSSLVNSMTITSVASNQNITGEFKINPKEGTIVPGENGGRTISISFPNEGLELNEECKYIIATIPAAVYPEGFEIKLLDSDKKVMRRMWLRHTQDSDKGVTVTPGKITCFDNQTFDTDSREICSAEDWDEFANAFNSGDDWQNLWLSKSGAVIIGGDFSAEKLTRIESVGADVVIDGRGHQITQTLAEKPLFGIIEGCVKNLTLSGNMNAEDPYTSGTAAFCSVLAGGTISDCLSKMHITVNEDHKDKAVKAGVFAAEMNGGIIANCSNEGKIDIQTGLSTSKEVIAGGIVGIIRDLKSKAVITDCSNNADISVKMEKTAAGTTRPNKAGYGGVVGVVLDGDAEKFLELARCTNMGNVSVSFATDPSSAANFNLSGAGGIIGLNTTFNGDGNFPTTPLGFYMEMSECTNRGNVYNGLASNASSTLLDDVCAGGLAGIMIGISDLHVKIDKCANYGIVKTYEGTSFKRATYVNVCGGLCGIGGWADFSKCDVISDQIGTVKGRTYSVSAGIGLAIKSFTIKDCKFDAGVQAIRCTDFTEGSYSLAFCATKTSKSGNVDSKYGLNLNDSKISGCKFKGSITTNSTLANANNTAAVTATANTLTADTFQTYIISQTSGTTPVVLEDNTFWEE